MDYRFFMLGDPKLIKMTLDEFGGRSDDEAARKPGWVSKLATQVRVKLTLPKWRPGRRKSLHRFG
jgi:hypothetical protein